MAIFFITFNDIIQAQNGRTAKVVVRLVVEDAVGTVNITDLMLQGGTVSTMWGGHPSEINWTVDG